MIRLPKTAKVVHVGAIPPRGDMFVFAECSELSEPVREIDIVVLKNEDEIPSGYEFMGYILAHPPLFVYERTSTILHA